MVIPFSINPSQFALVVVALGLAHVRIASAICVGVRGQPAVARSVRAGPEVLRGPAAPWLPA